MRNLLYSRSIKECGYKIKAFVRDGYVYVQEDGDFPIEIGLDTDTNRLKAESMAERKYLKYANTSDKS